MNFDYVKDRPTEMLVRQLQANRNAARYRNPETGKRHHAHIPRYRPFFAGEMLAMRNELKQRRNVMLNPPWSQPVCEGCYIARFGVPCHPKVRAASLRNVPEKCIDCAVDTKAGIYINPTDKDWTDKEMDQWRATNPE